MGPPNGIINAADLNGDGEITPRRPGTFDASWDVFVAFKDGPPMLFLNTLPGPTGTEFGFVDVTASHIQTFYATVNGADIGDVDLDGDIDIALAISTQPQLPHVILLLNDGRGRFTVAQNEVPSNYSILMYSAYFDDFHVVCRDVNLSDVDADGDLDMLLTYSGSYALPVTMGALNAFFVNRLIPDNFNTMNRFRTYRSPYLLRLSPSAGYQGTWVTVNIVGNNLDSGIKSLIFGAGVTAYNITRVGPNAFTTKVKIDRNAAGGVRNVTAVLNDGKTALLRNAFTVLTRPATARPSWGMYK
ncbi:MAG: hypothetical protein N3D11_09530 [Candidatus Sumerlaeia bacterium]|nr:hypothetical protein [Candidatus Sumerlaeia bacterium]